jgi:hypothetical protein
MKFKDIREFFWPMLDPLPADSQAQQEQSIDIYIHDDNIDVAFDLKMKFTDNEEDRRKGVETKAAMMLGSISLATSLVVGADSFVGPGNYFWARILLKVILLVLCIYTVTTVIFAMRCLSRSTYHTLGFDDINVHIAPQKYKRELIIKMHKNLKANQITINEKVDHMVMAQEFYKRSIIIICLYAFCGLVFTIIKPTPPVAIAKNPTHISAPTSTNSGLKTTSTQKPQISSSSSIKTQTPKFSHDSSKK